MKKLMVLDGNSIVNRAFYGVSQNLTTRAGQPTNAIFGFLNILIKLLDEGKPDALCVTFDRKAPTFRHLAYEGYKATRKGMPDELASQLPLLKEVLAAMNIPLYELDGWEADDLIGTKESDRKEPERITLNVADLLDDLIRQSDELVGKPVALMTKEDKIKAIHFLNTNGAMLITKSGDKIAKHFGISKYTLYSYLDSKVGGN